MLIVGDVVDMPSIRFKLTVHRITPEKLDLEFELGPHSGGTPLHIHPNAVETYEVITGTFDANLNGVWRTYGVGEKIVIKKGVPHTFRNPSSSITRVLNSHQPGLRMAEYFEQLGRIANRGIIQDSRMTLKAIIYTSMLMNSFKDEISMVNPPSPIINLFGLMGKLAGYQI